MEFALGISCSEDSIRVAVWSATNIEKCKVDRNVKLHRPFDGYLQVHGYCKTPGICI